MDGTLVETEQLLGRGDVRPRPRLGGRMSDEARRRRSAPACACPGPVPPRPAGGPGCRGGRPARRRPRCRRRSTRRPGERPGAAPAATCRPPPRGSRPPARAWARSPPRRSRRRPRGARPRPRATAGAGSRWPRRCGAPRSWKGSPAARNSSSIHPTPTPSTTRPPEKRSSVAAAAAVEKGWRSGSWYTSVPSSTRSVAVAATVSTIQGSSIGVLAGRNVPASL